VSMPLRRLGATMWRGSAQVAGSVAGDDWLACVVVVVVARPRYLPDFVVLLAEASAESIGLWHLPRCSVVGVAKAATLGTAGRGLAEER
jgi:hypothetical protein